MHATAAHEAMREAANQAVRGLRFEALRHLGNRREVHRWREIATG